MPTRVPCRVMTKSVGNEEHNYVPDTDHMPKFDGITGCKITQKNKCTADFKYIYPMLDPDGKTRLVTERDFHKRIMHKYRHFGGYDYIYPVLTMGVHEGKRSDLIPAPKVATCFVPDEVNRMIPQGVEQILTHYDDRSLLYIASRRGDIYLAATRTIPIRGSCGDEISKPPSIKSVSELNEQAEPKPTKKQMRDIDRWKKQMEELNRFGDSLSGNRIVYFGCELNRNEWQDDVDILSWFAENYPEETEDVSDDQTCECTMNGDHENVENSIEGTLGGDDSDFEENWKLPDTSSLRTNSDVSDDFNTKSVSQSLQDMSSSSPFSVERFLDCSSDFEETNEILGEERSRSRQL